MFDKIENFVRETFQKESGLIPLHEPFFTGKEKQYVNDAIDSTFVSSVGEYVNKVEEDLVKYTGAKFAVAIVNGTSALHMSLLAAGVERNDEVIGQALTFVATCNAISYIGAHAVFLDVDKDNLGLSPNNLESFLSKNTFRDESGNCINKNSKRKISAVVVMHSFGNPADIEGLMSVCNKYELPLIEDAAESLGSMYRGQHTGTFGKMGVLSFNGNKIATAGGGGAILTNDESLAKYLKHITTTAKVNHAWDFYHDMLAYNYRMPNLNAAFLCGQLEHLEEFVKNKRELANSYFAFFKEFSIELLHEPENCRSNYWLNALFLKNKNDQIEFLKEMNNRKIMCRPAWKLMNELPMYKDCENDGLENSINIQDTLVNIPSSVRP